LFLLCIVLLTASVAVGLNPWPGEPLLPTQSPSFKKFFIPWHGHSILIAALFWRSLPRPREQA
jgi:hypothetical protein